MTKRTVRLALLLCDTPVRLILVLPANPQLPSVQADYGTCESLG